MITTGPIIVAIEPLIISIVLLGELLAVPLLHLFFCCTIIQQLIHLFSELYTHKFPVTTRVIIWNFMPIYPCKHMLCLMHDWRYLACACWYFNVVNVNKRHIVPRYSHVARPIWENNNCG
ncbi:hypothetical protein V1506DRAFT_547609 [Lipomyces tetrasporus]